jgi:hypothetical protein
MEHIQETCGSFHRAANAPRKVTAFVDLVLETLKGRALAPRA